MKEFGRLESSEKTIAILGDRWWPQTAKQDGDRISKQFVCNTSSPFGGEIEVGRMLDRKKVSIQPKH